MTKNAPSCSSATPTQVQVFGWLTGRCVEVSNYPGTTVEVARGTMQS